MLYEIGDTPCSHVLPSHKVSDSGCPAGAQTYALDTGFLIEEFIRSQGVLPRGLAHPIIFGVRPPEHMRWGV